MPLFHRQAQIEDLPACLLLFQKDFTEFSAKQRQDVLEMWEDLLQNQQALSSVIEERNGDAHRVVGFGMSIFVTPEFAQSVQTSTAPFIVWEVVDLWAKGELPALSLQEIREANKGEGLDTLGLHSIWGSAEMSDAECAPIRDKMLDSLFHSHRGYNMRSFTKEIYGDEEYERHLAFGFQGLRTGEKLSNGKTPYLIGFSREEAQKPQYEGRLIRELFRYTSPQCSFTQADQETLQLALAGFNESHVADILGISKNSVKSRWDSIYLHIPAHLDRDLFHGVTDSRLKSRALLHWLRKHPQELRPGRFYPGIDLVGDYTANSAPSPA